MSNRDTRLRDIWVHQTKTPGVLLDLSDKVVEDWMHLGAMEYYPSEACQKLDAESSGRR